MKLFDEVRVVKKNNKYYVEARSNFEKSWSTQNIRKENASWWDLWCGTNSRPAIFDSEEEAITFAKKFENKYKEEIVYNKKF